MKKLFSVILLVCMIPLFASAENLTDLTFDELLILQRTLTAEIMSRPEWKEVEIPTGFWIVGEDIPAGTYTMTTKEQNCDVVIWKGAAGDRSNKLRTYYLHPDEPVGKISLEEGWTVEVTYRKMILSPFSGLGF